MSQASPPEIPMDPEGDDMASALTWARAILWGIENMNNAKVTKKSAGTAAKYTMWKYGRDDPKGLMVQMAPKALSILDKNKGDQSGGEIADAENLSIAELEELLVGALAEVPTS